MTGAELERRGYELRDGLYVAADEAALGAAPYVRGWEEEATADHVRSAIARAGGDETYEALTAKLTPIWEAIPIGAHYPTLLDLGCGYGRIALALSRGREVTCDTYVGVDVSAAMLRHLLRYRDRFAVFQDANVFAVRASAHRLPLDDGSVDLAVSSAVFLHMGKRYLRQALAEVARVLRPGGGFAFENSFPNLLCPANLPGVARGVRRRRPNQVNYFRLAEVRRLLRALDERAGPSVIEPVRFALLPNAVRDRPVPFARAFNRRLQPPPRALERLLAVSYSARSETVAPPPATGGAARAALGEERTR